MFPVLRKSHNKQGFITKEQLLELAKELTQTDYGKYLVDVANGL